MAWNAEYWDLLTNLYWDPQKLGCRRIIELCEDCKKKQPAKHLRSPGKVIGRLKRLEEPLNDIFNFFLRIAPSQFPGKLFSSSLSTPIVDKFEFLGQEIAERYGFGDENITQQDVFLVAERTLLMIELKINSSTDLLQVSKYALLAALEEKLTGPRDRIVLVFLTPEKPFHRIWKERFSDRDEMWKALKQYDPTNIPKQSLAKVFAQFEREVVEVIDRLEIGFMTYAELTDNLLLEKRQSDPSRAGDETLINLVDGLNDELVARGLAQPIDIGSSN